MNRTLKRAKIMDDPHGYAATACKRCYKVTFHKANTATASWIIKVEQDVVGWDIFRSTFSQDFSYNGRKVTDFGRLKVEGEVTGWGEAIGYKHEGVIGSYAEWESRLHRWRTSSKTDRYHACAPLGPGCILGKDEDLNGELTIYADGTDTFNG